MARWQDHIERNPGVMLGKPVIKGTRITVELILELFAAGSSVGDILESYPHLTEQGIRGALDYAAHAISTDEIIVLDDSAA